jgi:hypothetical protein
MAILAHTNHLGVFRDQAVLTILGDSSLPDGEGGLIVASEKGHARTNLPSDFLLSSFFSSPNLNDVSWRKRLNVEGALAVVGSLLPCKKRTEDTICNQMQPLFTKEKG